MIYRVDYMDEVEGSEGYEYFGSLHAAKNAVVYYKSLDKTKSATIDKFPTPKTKKQVLSLLNRVAVHNDNG